MSLIFIPFPERGKFCFCISKQLKSKERNHSQVWYHDPNLDYCITYVALQLNVCRFPHFQEVLQVRMKRIPVDIKIWIHVNKVLREQYKNRTSQKSTAMIKWDLKLAPWWTKHHYMITWFCIITGFLSLQLNLKYFTLSMLRARWCSANMRIPSLDVRVRFKKAPIISYCNHKNIDNKFLSRYP